MQCSILVYVIRYKKCFMLLGALYACKMAIKEYAYPRHMISHGKIDNICVLVGFSRSLRNCSLRGPVLDLSRIQQLGYMLVALFYFPFLIYLTLIMNELLRQKDKYTRLNKILFTLSKITLLATYTLILIYINFRDLSSNQLNGTIPQNRLSMSIMTM